jgi:uncharacterized membrane protein YqjE
VSEPYPSTTGSTAASFSSTSGTSSTEGPAQSVGELIGEITTDLSTLMRQEIELAKAEIKQEAAKAGKGAGMLAGAGYAGHLTLLFLSLALVGLLWAWWDSLALAALVVAVLWGIVAAVLAMKGKAQLKTVNPKPEHTVETLKEDVQWAKHPTR